MKSVSLGLALGLLVALAAEPSRAEKAPKIVVLDVQSAPTDATTAKLVGAALARSFQELHKGELITVDEARALIDAKAKNDLLGCADPRCAQDIADLLAADQVLTSVYGVVAGTPQLAVTLLDARAGRVLDRFSTTVAANAKGMDASIRPLAVRALNPGAAVNGDQALKELRTAVLVRELGPDKTELTTTPLGACVQQGLVDAGVPVISALQRARLKSQLTPDKPAADALASLNSNDADVVVVGTVQYAVVGKVGTRTAMRAGLTYEIIKVDTGELIAAGSAKPMQNAVSEETAIELAADKACGAIKASLDGAIAKRLDRGHRLVVEVPLAAGDDTGGTAAAVADAVVAELQAEKNMVARARVTGLTPTAATLDVTLRGVDGVAFALQLQRTGRGERVREASAARLVLKPATTTAAATAANKVQP